MTEIAHFGYKLEDESFVFEQFKGPLNLAIILLVPVFFASLIRVARFTIITRKATRKVNYAAEAMLIWAYDKLFTVAQLHLFLTAFLGLRNSDE